MDNRIKNIQYILSKLGLKNTPSKSGDFDIWIDSNNSNIVFPLPKSHNDNFEFYENLVIEYLLDKFELGKGKNNFDEVKNQIEGFNYKLISRIAFKSTESNDSIPIELAQIITSKNINAFRTFYNYESKGEKEIPIENFKLNHTKKGSFVIPVSILYDVENTLLDNIPNKLNIILHNYLQKIDGFKSLDLGSKESFVSSVQEQNIYSKVVTDFLSSKDSIANTQSKYINEIDEISITSAGNPLLDLYLSKSDKNFPIIKISDLKTVPLEFINYLEEVEINENELILQEKGVNMAAEVDGINVNGTARFTIYSIGSNKIEKPFKAITVKLSDERITQCADSIKNRSRIIIYGDITKKKGKVGEIIIDDFTEDNSEQQQRMFDVS
jgi:hypothetical protein